MLGNNAAAAWHREIGLLQSEGGMGVGTLGSEVDVEVKGGQRCAGQVGRWSEVGCCRADGRERVQLGQLQLCTLWTLDTPRCLAEGGTDLDGCGQHAFLQVR